MTRSAGQERLATTEPDEPASAYIGLGSNLGDGAGRLRRAVAELDRLPRTAARRRSSFYRSLPMGVVSQPRFVNAVVQIDTRLSPAALLAELHRIERRFGRTRRLRWGPRTLDLDLLVYGGLVLARRDLTIPHPGIPARAFVLHPLREIAPRLDIPGVGTPARLAGPCPGPAPARLRL